MSFRSRKDGSHYPITPKTQRKPSVVYSPQQLLSRYNQSTNAQEKAKLKKAAISMANKTKSKEWNETIEKIKNTANERSIKNRIPSNELQNIAHQISTIININSNEIYIGGSQSPKSNHLPNKQSDIDLFVYPKDFDENNQECWEQNPNRINEANEKIRNKLKRNDIHLSFLPKSMKYYDHVQINKMK